MHKKFMNEGLFNIYLVGGYVRDTLLKKPAKDFDYVVEPKSEISIEMVHKHLLSVGFVSVGKDFPVYKKDDLDIALPRTEKKVGSGYYGFETEVEGVGIEEDLLRRDLTINSVAYNVITKEYVEPRGVSALKDLAQKKLRPTSEAFVEDPLRFVRLARMSAKMPDFEVVYEDFIPMLSPEVKKEISELPKERVFAEILKVLETQRPSNFFKVLKKLDILDIVMPDIAKMVGKEQSPKYHAEGDVFEHTMFALDQVTKMSNDPKVRFGTLMHDIGKSYTYVQAVMEERDMREAYFGHSDTELVYAILEGYVDELKFPKEYVDFAYRSAGMHHYLHGLEGLSPKKLTKLILNISKTRNEDSEEKTEKIQNLMKEEKWKITPREDGKGDVKKKKNKKKLPGLIVSRPDIEDLITVAKSDAYARLVQEQKNPDLPLVELNELEVLEAFEKGRFKKGDSLFKKGELVKNTDYEMLLDLYDYVKQNEERYRVTGEMIEDGVFNNQEGRVDEVLKEEYIYGEMLKVVKAFKKQYDDKKLNSGATKTPINN